MMELSQIDEAMSDLQSKFEVQDEGNLSDYLGEKIKKHPKAVFKPLF
jgi:hypothetical protein